MRKHWQRVAALTLGALILGGGVLGASARGGEVTSGKQGAQPSSGLEALSARAVGFASFIGLDDDGDGAVAPGTLDDGAELLPQAAITLEQAIAAAQTAATGPVGEVDLEEYRGQLVFNVDVGPKDVKVDAATAEVIGIGED